MWAVYKGVVTRAVLPSAGGKDVFITVRYFGCLPMIKTIFSLVEKKFALWRDLPDCGASGCTPEIRPSLYVLFQGGVSCERLSGQQCFLPSWACFLFTRQRPPRPGGDSVNSILVRMTHWKYSSQSEQRAFIMGFIAALDMERMWQGDKPQPVGKSLVGVWTRASTG